MPKVQTFWRGDKVSVRDHRLGRLRIAIVLGSYADQYGGDNRDNYNLMNCDTGYSYSWFSENQLIFREHVGEEGIKAVQGVCRK